MRMSIMTLMSVGCGLLCGTTAASAARAQDKGLDAQKAAEADKAEEARKAAEAEKAAKAAQAAQAAKTATIDAQSAQPAAPPPLTHADPVALPVAPVALQFRPAIKIPGAAAGTAPAAASMIAIPYRTTTATVEVIGNAVAAAAAITALPRAFVAVRLTTAAMEVAGNAASAAAAAIDPSSFAPVRIRTSPMEVIGAPRGVEP